ncbi:MAG: hypothetical protein WCY56_08105 [Aminobacteriaceae bacterium]
MAGTKQVSSTGVSNYEVVRVELLPNGEFVTAANGDTVFIRRPGGVKQARITLTAHFFTYSAGVSVVGDTFTYLGVVWVVESFDTEGHPSIKGIDGEVFDGRSYTITARSVSALSATVIERLNGSTDGGAP